MKIITSNVCKHITDNVILILMKRKKGNVPCLPSVTG